MAQVKITFLKDESGAVEYTFPVVFHITDPKEGMKATVIKGVRGDGSIVIPGGKNSQEIRIRGKLYADGYEALTTLMNTLKANVTTGVGTLTMKHKSGLSWATDWTYIVRRITEIRFPESLRTDIQEYEVSFLVIAY